MRTLRRLTSSLTSSRRPRLRLSACFLFSLACRFCLSPVSTSYPASTHHLYILPCMSKSSFLCFRIRVCTFAGRCTASFCIWRSTRRPSQLTAKCEMRTGYTGKRAQRKCMYVLQRPISPYPSLNLLGGPHRSPFSRLEGGKAAPVPLQASG